MNFGGDPTDSKSESELAKFRINIGDKFSLLMYAPGTTISSGSECLIYPNTYGRAGAYKYTSKDIYSSLMQLAFLAGLAQLYREGQFWMHRPYM